MSEISSDDLILVKMLEQIGYKVVDAKRLRLLENVADKAAWFIAYRGTTQEGNRESELANAVAEWEEIENC